MTERKEVMINFIVVHTFFPYTIILSRPWIHAMGVVSSTLHMKVKFPTEDGIVMVRGDQQVTQHCLVTVINHEIKLKEQVEPKPLQQLIEPAEDTGTNNAEELIQIRILLCKDRYFQVGKSLSSKDQVAETVEGY